MDMTPDFYPAAEIEVAEPILDEATVAREALRAEFIAIRESAARAALEWLQAEGIFERFEITQEGHGPWAYTAAVFVARHYSHADDQAIRQRVQGYAAGPMDPSLSGFPAVLRVHFRAVVPVQEVAPDFEQGGE